MVGGHVWRPRMHPAISNRAAPPAETHAASHEVGVRVSDEAWRSLAANAACCSASFVAFDKNRSFECKRANVSPISEHLMFLQSRP